MSRSKLTILLLALAASFLMTEPALAGHGGGGHGGGGHGGGGHGGGGHGGGHSFGGHHGVGFGGFSSGFGYGFYSGYSPYPVYGTAAPATAASAWGYNPYPVNGASIVGSEAPTFIRQSNYYTPPEPVADNRACIHVRLPADALLWFDGEPTTCTGTERDYVTPELPSDKTYTYKVKVRWMQGGQPVERAHEVKVRRNETTTADFNSLPPSKG
jgi:uncharacterized protein (TIGR03000 family)